MKLRYLGSNKPGIFPPIYFHDGLNVVFARVTDPGDLLRDSHNLGKTFLLYVIDFALLGGIDKDHPFKSKQDRFGDFVFTLIVEAPGGDLVTIRRPVRGRAAISLHRHATAELTESLSLPSDDWTAPGLGLREAEETVDTWLDLTALRPYSYRKALNYVLRRQPDYHEVFRVSKFSRGRDVDWKPLMALLLGFNPELIGKKYALDEEIEELGGELTRLEQEAGSRQAAYDELAGLIELQDRELTRLRVSVDQFSFRDIEKQISRSLVDDIEQGIARINERVYTLRYEIQEIDHSLATGFEFDLEEVARTYQEAGQALPEQLVRSYEELVEFTRGISSGRRGRLSALRDRLVEEGTALSARLERLDDERSRLLSELREEETMRKYRQLQRELIERERELSRQRQRLAFLDRAASVQEEIAAVEGERQKTVNEIRRAARGGNELLRDLRARVAEYVEKVLHLPALVSVTVNAVGNLEFETQTLDRDFRKHETDQGKGMSYRKLLCAAFDLALVSVHAKERFYRFVYHDGILEGLDNRKKREWLTIVRRVTRELGLQYILTVIDTDIPRDEEDRKMLFGSQEIVRDLHDDGDEGRLFRMPAF